MSPIVVPTTSGPVRAHLATPEADEPEPGVVVVGAGGLPGWTGAGRAAADGRLLRPASALRVGGGVVFRRFC